MAKRRIFSVILSMSILLGLLSGISITTNAEPIDLPMTPGGATEPTEPDIIEPSEPAVPDITEPDIIEPSESADPDTSEPDSGGIALDGLVYQIVNGEAIITGYTGSATELIIPGVIEGYSVSAIGDNAFFGCRSLTSITIPDSVTRIDNFAFYYCISLTGIWVDENNSSYSSDAFGVLFNKDKSLLIQAPGKITGHYSIPNTVTSIRENAFAHCSSLTGIIISENVDEIAGAAFERCTSLTDVVISNGVIRIGDNAFYGCESLTSIIIPDSVTHIGWNSFYGCDLQSISIGNGITTVGDHAFSSLYEDESNITFNVLGDGKYIGNSENPYVMLVDVVPSDKSSFDIPVETKIIYDRAFRECENLTSISIPKSVTCIGSSAFYNCINLVDVYYSGNLEDWMQITFMGSYHTGGEPDNPMVWAENLYLNGVLLAGEITIPYGTTHIGEFTFQGCENITGVIFPDTLEYIGQGAFANCCHLTNITIPYGTTHIGYSAFHGCENITEVILPDTIEKIGGDAFASCYHLTNITIPDSVTVIEPGAFICCTDLTMVFFEGDAVGTFELFYGSTNLTAYYPANNPSWTEEEMQGYGENITWVPYIPSEDPVIASGTFGVLTWELHLSGTLVISGIGGMVDFVIQMKNRLPLPWFNYRNLIKNVIINEGVTSIGANAFAGCSRLTNVTIPESVTSIGDAAFAECTLLEEIHYHGSMEQWEKVELGSQWQSNENMQIVYENSLNGDLDGDGNVNNQDVELLLWYTLFPETYSIMGDADFDDDGYVDNRDVEYLLWHTLFPKEYPL